jgi:ABC-type dipeptide/oligopeptide/nickel transport system permease subunit
MSPGFATFILMNNYFHDVATAMLLACGIVLGVMLKHLGEEHDEAVMRYAAALFRGVTVLFRFSALWIIASGMLRIATFRSFEWHNTTQKHFEAGLLVKYGIAAVMMIVGAFLWVKLSRRMKSRLRS